MPRTDSECWFWDSRRALVHALLLQLGLCEKTAFKPDVHLVPQITRQFLLGHIWLSVFFPELSSAVNIVNRDKLHVLVALYSYVQKGSLILFWDRDGTMLRHELTSHCRWHNMQRANSPNHKFRSAKKTWRQQGQFVCQLPGVLFVDHTKGPKLYFDEHLPFYCSASMHGQRRRKKRHTHGLKTVDITRGKNGYGFTISGQAPCILSCIVNGRWVPFYLQIVTSDQGKLWGSFLGMSKNASKSS